MRNAQAEVALLVVSLLALACDHRELTLRGSGGSGGGGAFSDGGSGDAKTKRAPEHHRPISAACPTERGPGLPRLEGCAPDGGGLSPTCWQDSDCTAGTNGRCLNARFACMSVCSYDACNTDADCPSKVPCVCRASAADLAANVCVTASNCAVDADCGPDGFCSPSVVNDFCDCPATSLCLDSTACYAGNTKVPCACGDSCGHGYYCHTPSDTCLDDSDCDGGTCNYDRLDKRWTCSICWPIP